MHLCTGRGKVSAPKTGAMAAGKTVLPELAGLERVAGVSLTNLKKYPASLQKASSSF